MPFRRDVQTDEINGITEFIDCSIQVNPFALDFYIDFSLRLEVATARLIFLAAMA